MSKLSSVFVASIVVLLVAAPGTEGVSATRSGRQTHPARTHAQAAPAKPASLEQALQWRLSRYPFNSVGSGALIVSLTDGRTLAETRAEVPLTPASTMKTLTASSMLDKLGPDWRYQTPFLVESLPVDGVLDGNLYVKGVCEPDLIVEKFEEIARGLYASGLREVRGDIVADLLYFDGEERPPEWPNGGIPNPYAAPISALAGNFSSVRVTVTPGPGPGTPANVVLEPLSDAVALSGTVRTIAKGRGTPHVYRSLERIGGSDGVGNRITVSGRIPYLSAPWEKYITIEDPSGVAIAAVKRAMQQAGIVVNGIARTGSAPANSQSLYTLNSKPLSEIVMDMNKNSNNFIAEMLLRTLGAETFGPPGSRDKGSRAVAAFLRTCGVDPQSSTLTDGSGLSRSNRLSASTLVRVLVRMWGDPRIGGAFISSLPVSGTDGTLKSRMEGIARGRVHAKTGTIDGVHALAGYVFDTKEGPVAFAMIVNGATKRRALSGIDDVCRILCTP